MTKKQANTPKFPPLAIVGIGCLFPKADNVNEYWSNIREGVDAITDIPDSHWSPEDYFDPDQKTPDMTYARRGGFINPVDFNPLQYGMSPNNIEATDTTQLLGMVVARQALLDAGYSTSKGSGDGKEFDRDRTSVIMGVTGTLELVIPLGARLGHPIWRQALADAGVDPETTEDVVQRISDSYVPWQENSFPGLLGNVAAGRIANRFDLGGTNCVVDAACASSLSAIYLASLELNSGRSDMAIAGGLDTFNDIFMYMCFSKTPALSPTGNSRPFALGGDGTIIGEGMGAVILKRLDDAQRDSDRIYAVIKGIGTSSDGRGNAIYAPNVSGQTKALEDAYVQANVTPDSIELIEAHGTGTSVGDAVEAQALENVYRKANQNDTWCAIGSVKSMIGHTKSAAGVAGMIKTVMALKHKVLPPTIKVDQPLESLEPGKAPMYVNTIKRPWVANDSHPRRAALSAFGFGGSNFHCVLEEVEANDAEVDWDGRVLLFSLGADSKEDLSGQLTAIGRDKSWSEHRALAAKSCTDFDSKKQHRLTLVVEQDKTDFQMLIQQAIKRLSENEDNDFWQLPSGISYASGSHESKTGLLFPGQGAQYVGMLRDLACQFPYFSSVLSKVNAVKGETRHGSRLSDTIYPVPVFSDEARQDQEDILRDTRNAQAAIGAVSLSGLRTLEQFGFKADVAAGHSYGELVALCAAGVFDETALHQLSLLRGSLMATGKGDRGSMLAVSATYKDVEKLIKDEKLDLVIANHNAPTQIVLSGATDQIEKAVTLCKGQKLHATQLPVSAAFHSKFVADAEAPFADALSKIELHENTMIVLANTTADCYPTSTDPSGQNEIKKLLARQLTHPVRFVEQIEKMYALGVRTFVEVGPRSRLSGLVKTILGDREFQMLTLDASSGKRHGQYDLASLLANLAVLDKGINLSQWDANYLDSLDDTSGKKPTMTIPLSGANYVMPREKRPAKPQQSIQVAQQHTDMKNSVLTKLSTDQQVTSDQQGQSILRATQASILALQKMQVQTAKLHQQYLQGQETAQQTIAQLFLQQQTLLGLENTSILPVTTSVQVSSPAPAQQAASINQTPVNLAPEVPVTTHQTPKPIVEPVVEIEESIQATAPDNEIHSILLEVIAEKTGYPLEMLSLDMSLDTDLGIDSIKRVEILSALQEKLPGAPTVNPEELGTFQFLENIVEFLVAGMSKVVTRNTQPSEKDTSAASNDILRGILLDVVAEKTGYPLEMLTLEMSLDTDLGIDSIKRVEILSVLQERLPDTPVVSPEELSGLQTLQQIADFLSASDLSSPQQNTQKRNNYEQNSSKSVSLNNEQLAEAMLEVVADKTGYPVDMLNLEMSLEADLGIDSIKRVEILSALQERMPSMPVVKPEDLGALQTLQQIVDHMETGSPAPTPETRNQTEIKTTVIDNTPSVERKILSVVPLTAQQEKILLEKNATVWVTEETPEFTRSICESLKQKDLNPKIVPLDAIPDDALAGLIILTPANPDQNFMKDSFMLVRRVSASLRAVGKANAAILVSVTQMGGQFGLDGVGLGAGMTCPVSGGIAGLIKTANKEWPEVSCKAIDINNASMANGLADSIVEECLSRGFFGMGPLEVGISGTECFTLELNTVDINKAIPTTHLSPQDVVIVTGGARGVTAEIAFALAEKYQTNLLLLGRSQMPESEEKWLHGLTTEDEIKSAVLEHNEKGLKLKLIKPEDIENSYRKIIADREIRNNLQRINATGVKVMYRAVDVRIKNEVTAAVDEARDSLGSISGIVHGAGVLADRLIEDKTEEQFSQVYATKVTGINSLLTATADDPLKVMVMFSSSTGRFGRRGQCDYAVANEILNKIAQQQAELRTDCRVVSVNWGPWDGGMVTPALKKIFEAEGVGIISLKAGGDYLMQEIAYEGPVEVVVLGSSVHKQTGAVITEQSSEEIPAVNMSVAFTRSLNIDDYAFLQSHVINGHAVLPIAMMAEWFAHGAMHDNPGLNYHGFRHLRVFRGVTLESDANIDLQILAGQTNKEGDLDIVPVELRSDKILHARAEIMLAADKIQQETSRNQTVKGQYSQTANEAYTSGRLFHGKMLQSINTIDACSVQGISAQVRSATTPATWMKQPIRFSWLADPLVLDSSFQMMILWTFEQFGIGSLPTAIGEYRQFHKNFPEQGCKININVIERSGHRVLATIEFIDETDHLIARIENYECIVDTSLEEAFAKNKLQIPSINNIH